MNTKKTGLMPKTKMKEMTMKAEMKMTDGIV